MKLLTPNDVRTDKEKLFVFNLKRSDELEKELMRKRQELEKLTLEYELTMIRQKETLDKEKGDYQTQLENIKAQVKDLESRRKDALVPLKEKWKELEIAEGIIKNKDIDLTYKLQKADEKLELLENRLDSLNEREVEATNLAERQKITQKGIDEQKEQVAFQASQFNDYARKMIADYKLKDSELKTKEAELALRERAINALKSDLNAKEVELANREKTLQDKYISLENTLKRFNN